MNASSLLSAVSLASTNGPTALQVVVAMLLAFTLCFPVALVYRHVQRSYNYSPAFLRSLFVFAWAAAILTLVIGNNLVQAIGLVAAVSVVRFRNALKSPYDAVYIFWSLAIGVSCGAGYYLVAILMVGIGCCFEMILHYSNFGKVKFTESVVKVELPEDNEATLLSQVERELGDFSKRHRKVNTVFASDSEKKVHVFMIQTRPGQNLGRLKQSLAAIEGVGSVSYIENNAPLFAA